VKSRINTNVRIEDLIVSLSPESFELFTDTRQVSWLSLLSFTFSPNPDRYREDNGLQNKSFPIEYREKRDYSCGDSSGLEINFAPAFPFNLLMLYTAEEP